MNKKVRFTVDVSPEMEQLLDRLAQEEGTTKSEVFRRAIGLYDVTREYQREGNVVGATKDKKNLSAVFVL